MSGIDKRPRRRRHFLSDGDERNYLSDVIHYHLSHQSIDSPDGADSLHRLKESLEQAGDDDGSVMLQDHWALLYEARGEFGKAAERRLRELQLIDRAIEIGLRDVFAEESAEAALRLAEDRRKARG